MVSDNRANTRPPRVSTLLNRLLICADSQAAPARWARANTEGSSSPICILREPRAGSGPRRKRCSDRNPPAPRVWKLKRKGKPPPTSAAPLESKQTDAPVTRQVQISVGHRFGAALTFSMTFRSYPRISKQNGGRVGEEV